jgi:hypothetical protein
MEPVRLSVNKSLVIAAEHPHFGRIEMKFDRITAQHFAAQLRAAAGVPMAGGPSGSVSTLLAELVRAQPAANACADDEVDALARRIAGVPQAEYAAPADSRSYARATAILACDEARGREQLAAYIAHSTSLDIDAGRRMLAAAGLEDGVDAEARRIAACAKR